MDEEMATATQATEETHKKRKHPAKTNPAEKMVEADINNKKQDNTMEDGAKPQTGVNKTPNLINVIASRTLEIRKLGLKLSRLHQ